MELKCNNIQKELLVLLEEVNVANYLLVEIKVHISHSTMATRMTKLKGYLLYVEKRYKVASNFVEEKALQVEKYQKDAEALKSLQDEVADLRRALYDDLQLTMQNMFEVRE